MKNIIYLIMAVAIFIIGYKIMNNNKAKIPENKANNQMQAVQNKTSKPEINNLSQVEINTEKSFIIWEAKKTFVRTNDHYGKVSFKEGFVVSENNSIKKGEFVIDMKSIDSEDLKGSLKEKLDNHLKSEDFFDVTTSPTSKLVINETSKINESETLIKADLTIKGITNPVEFVATMKQEGDEKILETQLEIDRTLWNVRFGSGKFFDNLGNNTIDDKIKFSVKIWTS